MAQASVSLPSVRKLRFRGNCRMDPYQILWEDTYPPYLQTIFFFFQNFQIFTIFFFVFVNTGPYGSQNCKALLLPQIAPGLCETFPEFLFHTKLHFWIFEILRFWILTIFFVFVNMGPYGSQNCKTLLLPQIAPEFCENSPEFLFHTKVTFLDFWNFEILNFNDFFSFSLTWDPMGAKIAKRYSFHKSRPNLIKIFLNFSLQYPHKVTFADFWNFVFFKFYGTLKFNMGVNGKSQNVEYLDNGWS